MNLWLWIFRRRASDQPPGPGPTGDYRADLLGLHNQYRGDHPLHLDPSLERAAQEHADDMARRGRLDHAGFVERAARHGLRAENAAWGQDDAFDCWQSWYHSASHRANALNPTLTRVGFGRNGLYWCATYA